MAGLNTGKSFKTRKDAETNTTFHSQDEELEAAKIKAEYQELSRSHDNLVHEYSLLKNELEVKLKDDKNLLKLIISL